MAKADGNTRLTDNGVKALKARAKAYRVADTTGIGLMIEVHPNGSKLWRLRFRQHGRDRMVSLGKFGSSLGFVNTQSAKAKAAALRASIKEGVDPVLQKHREKVVARATHEMTFEKMATEWLTAMKPKWSPRHYLAQERFVLTDLDKLAPLPLIEVDAPTLLKHLKVIHDRAPEMGQKARRACSMLFDFAVATGRATGNPAAPLRRALPAVKAVPRATLPYSRLPELLAAIGKTPSEPQTRRAFAWLALTAARSAEARGMMWGEVDADRKTWTIPPGRMKSDREHFVPITDTGRRILLAADGDRDDADDPKEIVFKGFSRTGRLSENAFLALLARAGFFGEQTGHGLRAMFSSWAHDHDHDSLVIEQALAHVDDNKVRAVYNRSTRVAQRLKLAVAWEKFLLASGLAKLL